MPYLSRFWEYASSEWNYLDLEVWPDHGFMEAVTPTLPRPWEFCPYRQDAPPKKPQPYTASRRGQYPGARANLAHQARVWATSQT